MSIEISNDTERELRLIENGKRIVSKMKLDLFKGHYELGLCIKQDKGFMEKRHGDHWYDKYARMRGISTSSVYVALKFVEKYPQFEETQDFITCDKITWKFFVNNMLPSKRRFRDESKEALLDDPEFRLAAIQKTGLKR
ncbi:MAG: hypothetical protein V1915_00550 [Candidatus Bathyarchaeota archaeon]